MAAVFVSHRRVDGGEATALAEDLRAAGHDVWLDLWEIGLGDSIVGRMNEGLHRAEYVVLCLSDSGLGTPYIDREWMSALARQLNDEGVKLLPVRLTGGEPPAILADIRYADLVTDRASGLRDLLAALA